MAVSKNSMIGNAGEYYVCAELCKRNVLALMTPKNNPLFDVMASNPDGKRNVQIQVKTMSTTNKQGWKLGVDMTKKRKNPKLFVVLVNMHDDKPNDYYIYKYDAFADRVSEIYDEYISAPDGHFKILHLWPPQNTPPRDSDFNHGGRIAT